MHPSTRNRPRLPNRFAIIQILGNDGLRPDASLLWGPMLESRQCQAAGCHRLVGRGVNGARCKHRERVQQSSESRRELLLPWLDSNPATKLCGLLLGEENPAATRVPILTSGREKVARLGVPRFQPTYWIWGSVLLGSAYNSAQAWKQLQRCRTLARSNIRYGSPRDRELLRVEQLPDLSASMLCPRPLLVQSSVRLPMS
jgi:hypothetical protein